MKLFRTLVERVGDGLHVVDPKTGRFIDVNESGCRSLGYSREEMLKLSVFDITKGISREYFDQIFREVKERGSITLELPHIRKDGSFYEAEVSLSWVALDREYLVAVSRDVTERKQKTDELRWKTALLEAQMNSTPDGILVVDTNGKISLQNRLSDKIWNIPDEENLRQDRAARLQFAAQRTRDPAKFLERVAFINSHADEIARDEVELIDGTIIDRYSAPIRDSAGKLFGRLWIFHDITKQRKLEDQFRQAQKLEAIGQLAGGVAHDFNNILAATMMHLGVLCSRPNLDPFVLETLRELEGHSERAANLTQQLLMFSRRSVMQMKPVEINKVVENLLKMLRRLLGENITIEFRSRGDLPSVHADPGMLDQVIMNLSVNARDAMPKGGRLILSTNLVQFTEADAAVDSNRRPGKFVEFTASDNGCGMDETVMQRIFEPFFTTKELGKGTGLGLATVYGIIQQHKGWVEVESSIGRGTTFHVYLPALDKAIVNESPAVAAAPPSHGCETILVVEDEEPVRRALRNMLQTLGYHVLEAPDGRAAIKIWAEHKADVSLLLTDMVMPEGMTGLDLLEQLRKENPALKAIISSGYSAEISEHGLPDDPHTIYLPKPFGTRKLSAVVRHCLDQN